MILGHKSNTAKNAGLSVEGAYVLWRLQVDRNTSVGHLNVLKNYIHDKDFSIYVQKIIYDYQKEKTEITKLLNEYSISGPDPNSRDLNIKSNTEAMADQEMAQVIYRFMRLDVNLLLLNIRNVATNDAVQQKIIGFAKEAINRINTFIKYLKVKNWLLLPPMYPGLPSNKREMIAINEVYLLWDYLVYRYNGLRQIQIYAEFSEDPDFTALLNTSIKVQEKDIQNLEDKLMYYGIPFPKAYSKTNPKVESKEIYEDRFMFNTVLRGIQDSIAIRGSAVQEVIVNDELRNFFTKLVFLELDLLLQMAGFGKVKGWVNVTPKYKSLESE
ncbi:DUF3231 family protein [Candidatus Formimonas warabiya]|uniref:DUF3231 family protein n=1 Tax=Formimonas warabiya TaxID=1761012 RepID=A0A3G1KY96_FORW1|nr:DUF3231 family protein [Candidatus Formimonas warabiya]ATW27446.1 hypothetical protein DCMF_24240 [Candidatus Formimonas warabiya]